MFFRGATDQNHSPWPGTLASTCMRSLLTGGPGKEHGAGKLPTNCKNLGKVKRRGEMPVHMSYQPPRILLVGIHPGWAMSSPLGKTLSQDGLARDSSETNPITIKPETASHMAEQFSWVPLTSPSPRRHPFPVKSLALSALLCGPRGGPPSCNISTSWQTPQSLFE